jgi:hypothetical protein
VLAALLSSALFVAAAEPPAVSSPTASSLEALLEREGRPVPGVFRVAVPQADLRATLDGFPLVPAMGLTTWLAFSPRGSSATAAGELVLLEDEVGPVERAALKAGFSVTGLHAHFLRETPKVMFLQVAAHGALDDLQERARRVFAAITEARRGKGLQAGPTTAPGALDAAALRRVLGGQASTADGVARFVSGGTELDFEGTMDKAAAAGVFEVEEGASQAVVSALASAGLEVTAVEGRSVRFWGTGPALDLARALKAARAAGEAALPQ